MLDVCLFHRCYPVVGWLINTSVMLIASLTVPRRGFPVGFSMECCCLRVVFVRWLRGATALLALHWWVKHEHGCNRALDCVACFAGCSIDVGYVNHRYHRRWYHHHHPSLAGSNHHHAQRLVASHRIALWALSITNPGNTSWLLIRSIFALFIGIIKRYKRG